MTPQDFIAKWKRSQLTEQSAAQQHFLDLCDLLGQAKPAAADPDGAWYTFERGVNKTGGGKGWADVWMRQKFAWEYKGKDRDLPEAYKQLLRYREDLENPPLLVVCDMDRFEVHTNFTNTAKRVYAFDLDHLGEPENLDVLRKVFTNPEALKPQQTTAEITQEIAAQFGELADGMRNRKVPAHDAAHFLMKLMFCMFAEDVGLLPEKLFSKILQGSKINPALLTRKLKNLFEAMAGGGEFGADTILRFNGGLFADADVVELTLDEIEEVVNANNCDWSNVEPSIFGTLFERTLDPAKRSQIGAHYTSKEDIETLLEPVVMAPLRREWEDVKSQCEKAWAKFQQLRQEGKAGKTIVKARQDHDQLVNHFLHRLATVKILDPACGSGNFLYVAINLLLDLEKQVITYAAHRDISLLPQVRPTQLAGIEINPYAQQLAQVVIWIGYLQWMHHNGFIPQLDPVLDPIENIRNMDAIINPDLATEPEWPEAEFVVGNPPFLGGKKMRSELGNEYLDALFLLWKGRVRPEADLCCYWFEKARKQIETGKCQRAGLLATQGIRGGANRNVLLKIKESGNIFFAESDRDWVLEGANVHVSMVGFDAGTESQRILDGQLVPEIFPNLSASSNITAALPLKENLEITFMGTSKGGPFDVKEAIALTYFEEANPHGVPNSNVVVPWVNGRDISDRSRSMWIIDFGVGMKIEDASQFEAPFEFVRSNVKPERDKNARESYRELWWQHVEARPAMRKALGPLPRFLCTPRVSKHRLFVWLQSPTLPDSATFVFARSDDFFFGILHSRLHEVWARSQGTQVRERESGFRYTPTSCFETFPFPNPAEEQKEAISATAKELETGRNRWLNPPEWTQVEVIEFPGSVRGPWAHYIQDPDLHGIGTVRYPRIVPRPDEDEDDENGFAARLKKRTLTKLYNDRPAWLDLAHKKLDAAVFAAYGWDPAMTDEQILEALLALNLERAGKE